MKIRACQSSQNIDSIMQKSIRTHRSVRRRPKGSFTARPTAVPRAQNGSVAHLHTDSSSGKSSQPAPVSSHDGRILWHLQQLFQLIDSDTRSFAFNRLGFATAAKASRSEIHSPRSCTETRVSRKNASLFRPPCTPTSNGNSYPEKLR